MVRIEVFGGGYVGLVSAVCFAQAGHGVRLVETDATKRALIAKGTAPFYEPGLEQALKTVLDTGRLTVADAPAGGADLAILAVGTPAAEDGSADLTQAFSALDVIAAQEHLPQAIVVRSTVPVGSGAALAARLRALRPDWGGDAISNPEFMRQGRAMADFMQPDRVVIGAESAAAHALGAALYAPLGLPDGKVMHCRRASAELIKYAANTMLATRLALVNELALLAEASGADIAEITTGMGMDARIGPQFLQPGPGIGGSCFPKDIRALADQAQKAGRPMAVVEAVIASNTAHIAALAGRVAAFCGGDIAGARLAVLGVAFKAGTDDTRSSAALALIPALLAMGAEIVTYDPMARRDGLNGVTWAEDAYAATAGADCAIIVTEWPEFAALDLPRMAATMRQPRLMDLRNLIAPDAAATAGLAYQGIGRPGA